MVYRIFTERKLGYRNEATALHSDIVSFLGIEGLTDVRVINRYDVEGITEELFNYAKNTVFSEPQTDDTYADPSTDGASAVFAVEYLPGQYDQRADSAAQCIQLISQGDRPTVKTAKLYILAGELTENDITRIKHHVINPVEAREATLEKPETLATDFVPPAPVAVLDGFTKLDRDGLAAFVKERGLAMDNDDIAFCQEYFLSEKRDPTITEIKMIDTYWSDHCRHTTFGTVIDSFESEDTEIKEVYDGYIELRRTLGREHKPICLMDIATVGARYLKATGKLTDLDESEEINACTVKIKVDHDGVDEDWLLLFKNETHNHPTEIEPFGGAATCIGGAIRDPLSGRSYVYAAMRVTGAGDPTLPASETLEGKLPQYKLVTTAAAGYSSYGNQIGLATGAVNEIYHPGYVAKRMEIGAVLGAAPAENVIRLCPEAGDVVILLGGRTGRDGIGGATGSSKSHTTESLSACGAEVQKGNAPEERKLQRLFRSTEASRLIKRCNDFGAGGVSVAVGELADGLDINLDAVPKKYDGLDGTELAISESQERMAVVVAKKDMARFIALAEAENLEATHIATVTEAPRLVMRNGGKVIVDISRDFLNSNGAPKHIDIKVKAVDDYKELYKTDYSDNFEEICREMMNDLNIAQSRGLSERFDATIGRGTVLMPFGGKYQLTPAVAMAHKIPVEVGDTTTVSYMAWGYNPFITEKSPYHGAYLAVIESAAKLVASGAPADKAWLTFQEYFPKPKTDAYRWGMPASALLGALKAQLDLGYAAIGGKDSMSGSFEDIDVPPTLVSFAVSVGRTGDVISPEFKAGGHKVVLITPEKTESGLPKIGSYKAVAKEAERLIKAGAAAASTPGIGGALASVIKMTFGNGVGIKLDSSVNINALTAYEYGAFILELPEGGEPAVPYTLLGVTTDEASVVYGETAVSVDGLYTDYENRIESVYPVHAKTPRSMIPEISYEAKSYASPAIKVSKPKFLIPVFPGTNCEFDSAAAVRAAGGEPEIFVINNMTASHITESVNKFASLVSESQAIFIPGGFSGGDEPDGSGKFITAFFRAGAIKEEVNKLLKVRDGLMCGICNGFQALIKLGLVPYGEITDPDENAPTLTFNTIGRHQSRIVYTRVASNKSPWLMNASVGDIHAVPISHGEGRFIAPDDVIEALIANGQIATQYVDGEGRPTYNINYNPNGSVLAVEGITSPDGRVLGKMGHSERVGAGLYRNVPGNYDSGIFASAVKYFK